MSWNDERKERLIKLYGEGLSASIIADRLGGVTRNAVIGKMPSSRVDWSGGSRGQAEAQPEPQTSALSARQDRSVKTKVVRLGNTAFRRLLEQDAQPLPVVEELKSRSLSARPSRR